MDRTEQLLGLLKRLYLSVFVQRYQVLAEHAEKAKQDHVGYLYQLAQEECEQRDQRRIARLVKQAQLPANKRLADFELTRLAGLSPSLVHRLAEGNWIDRCETLLIFGNPGTGKTHLSAALAREWCLKGRRVWYTTACVLMQQLLRAKQEMRLDRCLKELDRYEVLVIDDISYVPCERSETDVLFVLLAARYEQRSVVITSNLVFSQWHQIFKDEMTTAAAIDRLVHHATVLELNAESYRIAQAKKRKKSVALPETNASSSVGEASPTKHDDRGSEQSATGNPEH